VKSGFVTFEGIEGSGKSTIAKSVHELIEKAGIDVLLTREPGGTEVSEAIRGILLDPEHPEMTDRAELLLYLASRAQLVEESIRPSLERGCLVLCDRFMDASVAYQGWARGLGEEFVERMNSFAVGDTVPDLTFVLDLPVEDGFLRGPDRREGSGERGKDRMEKEEQAFHEMVREGYIRLAARHGGRVVIVDSSLPFDAVLQEVIRNMEARFDVKII